MPPPCKPLGHALVLYLVLVFLFSVGLLHLSQVVFCSSVHFSEEEEPASGEDGLWSRDWSQRESNRTLVVYVYWERDQVYAENLNYFIRAGVGSEEESTSSQVDHLIIVQGRKLSVKVPPHVKIWRRPNTCFDFGAFGEALRRLNLPRYRFYFFLNSSVKGPFLPSYWPAEVHWSTIFTSRINERVKQVGTSIVCLDLPSHLGGKGPCVEGFAWATDNIGIKLGLMHGVFDCFQSKVDVIIKGEYGMSRTLLRAGFSVDSLQLKYQGVNWTDRSNWNCNNHIHPTRAHSYEGITMHPLETVFHKRSWTDSKLQVLPRYMDSYSKWKYQEMDRKSGVHLPA